MLEVKNLNKSYTNGVNTYPVLKDVSRASLLQLWDRPEAEKLHC